MTAEIKARAACLIGWPAAHSRSPLIHHYWLRTLDIEGCYNIEAVPPEGFAEFLLHLSAHGFVGANVTIPHKERALALSMPDARARAVGAANTLWYDNGELCSTNTDIEGFVNNLDACAPGWDAASDALVLGAGGASRAVVFGLIERGIKRVHLANRTIDRARARPGVRLARCTRSMPRSINPNTTARDAPPAPSTSASVAASHPGAQASRLSIKPSMSVLVERSSPPS